MRPPIWLVCSYALKIKFDQKFNYLTANGVGSSGRELEWERRERTGAATGMFLNKKYRMEGVRLRHNASEWILHGRGPPENLELFKAAQCRHDDQSGFADEKRAEREGEVAELVLGVKLKLWRLAYGGGGGEESLKLSGCVGRGFKGGRNASVKLQGLC